jgi:bifunctional oligoribonuclease and PAP phosphatase NrnA
MSLKKVVECIQKNNRFLVTSHTGLEGDALGSELAFMFLLKALGKEAIVVNDDELPVEYDFMPGFSSIKRMTSKLQKIDFDCFAVLDCADLSRCGEVSKLNTRSKCVLNIDHHISNTNFGDINLVRPYASSAAEVVFKIFKSMRVAFDRDTATLLYIGMLTDTGSFHYANTSSFTHQAVSELLKCDLDVRSIYKRVYENNLFEDMRLLIKTLNRLKRIYAGRVAWFEIEGEVLKRKNISFDLAERLLSFARSVRGVEVAVIFKENLKAPPASVRVNLRSQGGIDVNKIAAFFGGGGHKAASGCTVSGSIGQVKRMVLRKIKEALDESNPSIKSDKKI